MTNPHTFTPSIYQGAALLRCEICARFASDPLHIQTLPGMEAVYAEREEFRLVAVAEEDLTATMRRPLRDISTKAGQMERESPLFFGSGANPTLF